MCKLACFSEVWIKPIDWVWNFKERTKNIAAHVRIQFNACLDKKMFSYPRTSFIFYCLKKKNSLNRESLTRPLISTWFVISWPSLMVRVREHLGVTVTKLFSQIYVGPVLINNNKTQVISRSSLITVTSGLFCRDLNVHLGFYNTSVWQCPSL